MGDREEGTVDPQRRMAVVLLAATLASLIATFVAGYMTRLSLVEASWWVTLLIEARTRGQSCRRASERRKLKG